MQWLLFACLLGHGGKVPSSQPAGLGKVNFKKEKVFRFLCLPNCSNGSFNARSFPLQREKDTTRSQRASWQHMVLLGGGCKPCAGDVLFIPVWLVLTGERISRKHLSEQTQNGTEQWYGEKCTLCADLRVQVDLYSHQ